MRFQDSGRMRTSCDGWLTDVFSWKKSFLDEGEKNDERVREGEERG
jgi:hypothetical protein